MDEAQASPLPPSHSIAWTVGEIARRLSLPVHRIEYVIRTREIDPVGWAGNARVFAEADLDFIGSELRRMAEDRSPVPAQGESDR